MPNNKPLWVNKEQGPRTLGKTCVFVATPCHSECSIHYAQACLALQQACFKKGISISFQLIKSSLITQGRNLSVSNFLQDCEKIPFTHFIFIDSDICFKPETIFKLIEADKDVIAAPYTLKTIDWDKVVARSKGKEVSAKELSRMGFTWPVKIENRDEIIVKDGIAEVTHVPTGCLAIKKQVFDKMIDAYPNLRIDQPTIINGKEKSRPYFYNFFDTYFEPETHKYYGEDFGFCKRWTKIGGKCHLYVLDEVTHVGEYQYTGRLMDDLERLKRIDDSSKIK